MNLLAFNVSRTTSKPVLESTNRYAVLSIEGNNNNNDHDLRPWDDRRDAGDAAAATRGQSRQDLDKDLRLKVPVLQGLKSKPPSSLSSGSVQKNLKGPSQSPARAQAKVANPARHRAESLINNDAAGVAIFSPSSYS
ncbi:hypothetical protein ARMSODRAFT_1017827 [Armillaria solidipes]|uniref:Uncharacterized protein n=1 Tax=Armillaria solidipes TaxID=1076256 RepID=A0A2H3BKT7_9AGAR|nr:hypothetical protein ARMSODRAFT_1017827 [Armillaria solidipes]